MTVPAEFARPIAIDTIGEGDRMIAIEADADERRRLAARFALIAIDSLTARFAVRRDGAAIVATGDVAAQVVQACSVTGEPIPATVAEAVTLRFVDDLAAGEEEVELSDDALDTLPIEDGGIDLGEAAAETMALALDPFPRAPEAAAALRAAGVFGEDEARPFGALAGLKAKLGKPS
ncbi:DUF177 domain-containing protein [Sphingomonas sp.]|jgi:uncharacterized metal-binding protein YceD (DUF177 family)|uniref:YceD family protein n=1 Tax=Sphingomonas sp. TaxID=28214 RepID=UPI002EDA6212